MSKNKSRTLPTLRWIMLIGIFLSFQAFLMFTSGQDSKFNPGEDEKLANAAADLFMERYRKTLDVGPILDEIGSSATIAGLRKSHFLEDFGLDPQFVKTLDDETLARVYKNILNGYFMGALHNVFTDDEKEVLPKDVVAAFKKSSVGKPYLDWYLTDKSEGRPLIKSKPELTEYLRLNKEVAKLLRKHIPRDPFNSPVYLKQYEGVHKSLEMASSDYGEDFGFKKGTPVYFVRRDFFNLFFVKENNQMKLLFLGTGD